MVGGSRCMTTTRRALLGAGLSLPLLSLPGLSLPARAQSADGILRFGLSAFPPNLQPWVSTGAAAGTVKLMLHRSLVTYDSKGQLRGELAESWSVDDEGAWVFKLRPGCVFQNGDPVTADDVKWSIEQIAGEKSTAYMRTQFQGIERIEIPDPQTVRLVTKTPTATLPTWFANYNTFVLSRNSTPSEPIGAGPFRLAGQERGTSIELAAFDKFYKPGFPKLKGIRFIVYADENLRVAALQSGDVDMIEYVPWQSMGTVEIRPAAQARHGRGAVHVRAVQRHPAALRRSARAPGDRPCGEARGHRQGRLLRPRQAAGRRADHRRHALVRRRAGAWLGLRPRQGQGAAGRGRASGRLPDHADGHRPVRHAQGHRRGGAAASRRHRHPVRAAAARLVDPRRPRHARASTTSPSTAWRPTTTTPTG